MKLVDYSKEGKIAIFTLNRPDALNALSKELLNELYEAMAEFRDDTGLWVGIITGAGDRAFSVGADIKEFRPGALKGMLPDNIIRADKIWKPFIAAIHGYCLGAGLELALTCDLRIATDKSRMGLPEPKVGVIPASGGMSRLPRLIPRAKAMEILLTGQYIDAMEAYRIGLINKVVPPEQLMPTAIQYANNICEGGPLQIRAMKEVILQGLNMTLDESLQFELTMADVISGTEDFQEGARAFIEKRKPQWKGK